MQNRTRLRDWLLGLSLLAATVIVYLPALNGAFVWDDVHWLNERKHLVADASGLWRMWTDRNAFYLYYPLTCTTHWLDFQWWGAWTFPHHLENVLLHGLSAVLFWRLLRHLRVPGAWLAAAIYAVHPVMVESVAWISERKNVLCQVLYLAALIFYGRSVNFWEGDSGVVRRGVWWVALTLFVAALLAKITAFSLPPAILLLCWWKRGRIAWKSDVVPVLPFFAAAVLLGLLSLWIEAASVRWAFPWTERLLVAGRAPWFYLGKLLWPAGICFVYPQWKLDPSDGRQWGAVAAFLMAVVGFWMSRNRIGRAAVVAIFFFLGNLVPVLGVLRVYGMKFSYVADRWVYVSSLSLIALGVAAAARAWQTWGRPVVGQIVACVLLGSLAVLTWRQAANYETGQKLWRSVLAQDPQSWAAHLNLGHELAQEKRFDEAIEHYRKALEIEPRYARAEVNLGLAFEAKGEPEKAEGHYKRALEIEPENSQTRAHYARLLAGLGRHGEALVQDRWEIVQAEPKEGWRGLVNLAWTLATSPDDRMRNAMLAVELAERADKFSGHHFPEVLQVLAAAYAEAGRFEEAAKTAERAAGLAGDSSLARSLRVQVQLYRENKPYREKAAAGTILPRPATR